MLFHQYLEYFSRESSEMACVEMGDLAFSTTLV